MEIYANAAIFVLRARAAQKSEFTVWAQNHPLPHHTQPAKDRHGRPHSAQNAILGKAQNSGRFVLEPTTIAPSKLGKLFGGQRA